MLAIGFILHVNRRNLIKVKQEITKNVSNLSYGDHGYLFIHNNLEEDCYPVAKIPSLLQKYEYDKFPFWEACVFVSLVLSKNNLPTKKIVAITDSQVKNKEKIFEFIKNLNLDIEVNLISINDKEEDKEVKTVPVKDLGNLIKGIINGQDV